MGPLVLLLGGLSLLPVLFFLPIGHIGDGLGVLSTGDESADMSLYRSKDLVIFLSLFAFCGGVCITRLSFLNLPWNYFFPLVPERFLLIRLP